MDLPSLNALLRVNGLTVESSPENITDVLIRSGFTEEEVPEALSILKGAPPPTPIFVPGAYVAQTVAHTQTMTVFDSSIFDGRIGVLQFWMGTGLAIAVFGLVFLATDVSALSLYSLISGISLLSPPDLVQASVRSLLLFGIGAAMLILPALFLLSISVGLQVRRCHDFGLSGPAWLMIMAALTVAAYLLYRMTPLAALSFVGAFVIWVVLMSLPGSVGDNFHGVRAKYPSIWGAIAGSYAETECVRLFAHKFILPLLYLELFGIILTFTIHSVVPRAHAPHV